MKVFDSNTNLLLGRLIDITPEGIMLINEKPIEVDKFYQLKLLLPEEIQGKTEINFEVKSVWHGKDSNPDYHDTGFNISNISNDDIRLIEELIQRFGFND